MRIFTIGVLLGIFASPVSKAEGLFYDSCIEQVSSDSGDDAGTVLIAAYSGPKLMGLTCEDLKGFKEAVSAIDMALYPATLAITISPARDLIRAELAGLGLSMANPAVLGVTVIGAFGVVTLYFILRRTMEECEEIAREDLRRDILREVEKKYGISARGVQLNLRK